jgi:hypothetical protein
VSLPLVKPTTFNFESPAFTFLTALHAAYPFGTYSITTTVTSASTTGVINYTADYFTSTVPYLTNYTALNGLNPAAAFTFSFPAFTPNPSVTEGFTFLTIYDATTGPLVGNAFTTQGLDLRTEGSFTTGPGVLNRLWPPGVSGRWRLMGGSQVVGA